MESNIILSGFLAGSAQTIIGHPFDTIKTRIQINGGSSSSLLRNLLRNESIFALYKGVYPPLLAGCLQNSIVFSTENLFYSYTDNNVYSGFIAGGITSLFISPAELLKSKIQNERKFFAKSIDIIRDTKSLTVGIPMTFFRDSVGFSIYFGSYNYLQKQNDLPFLNGGISGVLSWIYSYPFDVVKTHQQIYNLKVSEVVRKLKPNKLIKGIGVMLCRSFFVNAGIFYLFEKLKKSSLY